jgi:hypothetical protein
VAIYRIYRLKDSVRQQFRWASHTAGATTIRPKDYESTSTIDAPTCYVAWTALRNSENSLQPGDVLESENGELRIFKYVGFEEAHWVLPDPKPVAETAPAAPQC